MGPTRAELDAFNGVTVPDLLGDLCDLLFVGINPGLLTAAVQAHFAKRGNRFYPALHRAGIIDRDINASNGFRPEDLKHLLDRGIGITSLVPGATARADELTAAQLVEGGARLTRLVSRVKPKVVAVLGITAYRVAFAEPRAKWGRQVVELARLWPPESELWVVPNPSGLNAHETVDSLARAYREVGIAAGLVSSDIQSDG